MKLSVNPHTLLCLPFKNNASSFCPRSDSFTAWFRKHIHLFMTRCANCIETNDGAGWTRWWITWRKRFYKKSLFAVLPAWDPIRGQKWRVRGDAGAQIDQLSSMCVPQNTKKLSDCISVVLLVPSIPPIPPSLASSLLFRIISLHFCAPSAAL